jgi:hypothetical protein
VSEWFGNLDNIDVSNDTPKGKMWQTLETIRSPSLLTHNIENRVNELSSFCVIWKDESAVQFYQCRIEIRKGDLIPMKVRLTPLPWAKKKKPMEEDMGQTADHEENNLLTPFCPVVSHATLAKDKIVQSEEATKRTGTDGIHSPGL